MFEKANTGTSKQHREYSEMKVIGDFVKSIRRGEDLNLPAQTRRTKEGISLCYNLNSTFSLFLFVFLAAREMSLDALGNCV